MKKVIPKDAVLIPEGAQRVFRGIIFDVYHWPQKMFDDSVATFEALRRPDTVTALCVVDDKIIVLEDEQPHTGSCLSFPGGRIDPKDTSPLSAVKREIKEETGFEFSKWKLVYVDQPHAKLEWFIHFYVAWDGSKVEEPRLDVGEKIKMKTLGFNEVKKLVLSRAGYLGESRDWFESAGSCEDLLNLPEFAGEEVDR